MAKTKKPIDPIKAKQRKQKKIAIGGGVLLLLLVVIQGPKLLKQVHKGNQTPAWLAESRQQSASGVATPPGTPTAAPATTPSAAAPASPLVAPTAPAGSAQLVADTPPAAAIGQVSTFGDFASKDPFAAQVKLPTAQATGSLCAQGALADTADCPPGSAAKGGTTPGKPPTPPSPGTGSKGSTSAGTGGGGSVVPAGGGGGSSPAQTPGSAVISVNGVKGLVAVGSDFPASAPFFHLILVGTRTAKVSIAGGSYASGAATLTLHQGKPVTLMNTADGTRYTLELFPPGTPAAAATGPSGGSSSATTGATTTVATTTSSG